MSQSRRIAFLYVGGVHHVTHTLPVAAALSRDGDIEVSAFCADQDIEAMVRQVLVGFSEARVRIERLRRPLFIGLTGRPSIAKSPMLWRNRRRFDGFDAIVVAECTSIALRRMGVRRPRFICLPHGAGDRAVSFEPRFRLFDRILVAGSKTSRRMVESGVAAERVVEIGYPKAEYLAGRKRPLPPFFAGDYSCILFNPHFRSHLSSLDHATEIVRSLAAEPARNLIVAPHIRVFEGASKGELARWKALEVPGKVLVDTGSERLIDMSYARAADLYLGDVSSQVYEFLLLGLRPCVFVNAHGVNWQADPDYGFWKLGTVVTPAEVRMGVENALKDDGRYRPAQAAAVADTFGTLEGSAERAAAAILECLAEPR